MKIAKLIKLKKEIFAKCIDLTARKGHDYSGEEDTLDNLKASERLGLCSAEVGTMVRLLDKFARINRFLKQGELSVQDEKIIDTFVDAHNYLDLLLAIIEEKQK